MKKLTALFLLLTMLFVLPACAESTTDNDDDSKQVENGGSSDSALTDEEIYGKAASAMKEVKNLTATATMNMTMDMTGESITTKTTSTVYTDFEGKRVYTVSESDFEGETMTSTLYYDSEVYMMDTLGLKYKAAMTADMLESMINADASTVETDFSDFANCTMTKTDDGYTFEVKGLKSDSSLSSLLGDSSEELEGYDIDLSAVEMTVQLDKDYRYTSVTVKMTMSMDLGEEFGSIKVDVDSKINYSDYNKSADKIVKPDDTDYEEIDLDELLGTVAE